jgi:hypothetical protein
LSRLGPTPAPRRVAIAKPKNDIYVALLAIALGAVLLAIILLAMEMNSYEWKTTPKAAVGNPFTSFAFSVRHQAGPDCGPMACGLATWPVDVG